MAQSKMKLQVVWNDGPQNQGTLEGPHLNTEIAISKASGGGGNGTSPKELLVSAALACYESTLVYMLDNRKLPVVEHVTDTEATMVDGGLHIKHYPKVVLASNASDQQVDTAQRLIEIANQACEVGKLLEKAGVIIKVEGEVSVQ